MFSSDSIGFVCHFRGVVKGFVSRNRLTVTYTAAILRDTPLTPGKEPPVFDYGKFLATNFQSPAKLSSFLRAFGVQPPSDEVVRKWFQRKTVPADWFAVLLVYLELDQGGPVSLTIYLCGEGNG